MDSHIAISWTELLGSSGFVGGGLTAVGLLANWVREHDESARNLRDIANVSAQVTFWKEWLETQIAAGLSEDELQQTKQLGHYELNRLAERMRALVLQKTGPRPLKEKLPVFFRQLFLLYPPPHSAPWLRLWRWTLRIVFYGLVVVGVMGMFGASQDGSIKGWSQVTGLALFVIGVIAAVRFLISLQEPSKDGTGGSSIQPSSLKPSSSIEGSGLGRLDRIS
jgi:hypothetical protein